MSELLGKWFKIAELYESRITATELLGKWFKISDDARFNKLETELLGKWFKIDIWMPSSTKSS